METNVDDDGRRKFRVDGTYWQGRPGWRRLNREPAGGGSTELSMKEDGVN